MSQKWIRSKRWDDENIPQWAWPAKFLLRAFSSIWLAVILLVLVSIYGTLASVPIGVLAKAPTFLLIGLSVVATIAIGAVVPAMLWVRLLAALQMGRAGRFAGGFLLGTGLAVLSVWMWAELAWPRLKWDPAAGGGAGGRGFMLFGDFIQRYKSVTLRRLPGMEMTELEFYAWWPLRVILLTFIVNMVTATVRRIEFTFHNIGVLTVHTGIVTIALGSIYYGAGKQEGDMLLRAGPPDEQGRIAEGRPESGFYDNTVVVLWLGDGDGGAMSRGVEQRPIRWLPRYNDYNLNVLGIGELAEDAQRHDRGRTLDIPVHPAPRRPGQPASQLVDPQWEFRIVGYANYAELDRRWTPVQSAPIGDLPTPMRQLDVVSSLDPASQGRMLPVWSSRLLPDRPSERVRRLGDGGAVQIEYTRGMPEARWNELRSRLPEHVRHALVVEVPAEGDGPRVFAAGHDARIEVGSTGYVIEVEDLLPQPPFPIITRGFENADSSVAILRVTAPNGERFTRYAYHRYPEINQDLLDGGDGTADGRQPRRPADPAIRIGYIDASVAQVYIDELPPEEGGLTSRDRAVRALVRIPGHDAVVYDRLEAGGLAAIAPPDEPDPRVAVRIGQRWPHAAQVESPRVVPEPARDRQQIGTHSSAAVAVRAWLKNDDTGWSHTFWVPFSRYLGLDDSLGRTVRAPDGREVTVYFGRMRHALPGMSLRLVDFQMFPYPHSDVPQDYRSDLLVHSTWNGEFRQELKATSLNAPLLVRVPFQPRSDVNQLVNFIGWVASFIAPNQYKFSQAGWDSEGWRQSTALMQQGVIERPFARFTILGVGNNPGIYVIAAGSIMMCAGIPWAFYIKPWLVRRQKRRIQEELRHRAAKKTESEQRPPEPAAGAAPVAPATGAAR